VFRASSTSGEGQLRDAGGDGGGRQARAPPAAGEARQQLFRRSSSSSREVAQVTHTNVRRALFHVNGQALRSRACHCGILPLWHRTTGTLSIWQSEARRPRESGSVGPTIGVFLQKLITAIRGALPNGHVGRRPDKATRVSFAEPRRRCPCGRGMVITGRLRLASVSSFHSPRLALLFSAIPSAVAVRSSISSSTTSHSFQPSFLIATRRPLPPMMPPVAF